MEELMALSDATMPVGGIAPSTSTNVEVPVKQTKPMVLDGGGTPQDVVDKWNAPVPAPAATPAKTWPNAAIRGEVVFWLGVTVGVMQLAFIIWSFAKRK